MGFNKKGPGFKQANELVKGAEYAAKHHLSDRIKKIHEDLVSTAQELFQMAKDPGNIVVSGSAKSFLNPDKRITNTSEARKALKEKADYFKQAADHVKKLREKAGLF